MTLARDVIERTYTIDEFMELPDIDDDKEVQVELVYGRVMEVPLAGDKHGRISGKLFLRLGVFVEDNDLGLVYGGDTNFVISKTDAIVRAPDVSFVSTAHQQPVTNGAVPSPPDLVVEVMSRHDYDHPISFREKIAQYQAAGVSLIWVVKPREKEVEVYHSAPAAPIARLRDDAEIDGELIVPNFRLKVSAIFKGVD